MTTDARGRPVTDRPHITSPGADFTSAYDRIRDAVETVTGKPGRRNGRGWSFRCPAHPDRVASLSVTPAADRVLVNCFAGCRIDDILATLNLTRRDLFDRTQGPWQRPWMPPKPAPDPGWSYVSEPPDVPDIVKLSLYAASTTEVPILGHHPGGPVPRW